MRLKIPKIPRNKESRKFITVWVLALILVVFTTTVTLLPSGNDDTATSVAQDTYTIISTPPLQRGDQMQLKTFKLKINPRPDNSCKGNIFNEEPDIIYATDPPFGGKVVAGGQIKMWIWEDDGNGASVAPGTRVNPTTGAITTIGDRTATDPNGYLWEPAIYLTKLTAPDQPGPYSGDKENGGIPHFPIIIKGVANFGGIGVGSFGSRGDESDILESAPIDPPVNIVAPRTGNNLTFSEFIWDVNSLGLTTGFYRVQIIMHDGDTDLAINCTTISI